MSLDWNACSTFHSRSSSDLAPCAGAGTPNDPFIVDWDLFDPGNPYNWSKVRKWLITMQVAFCTWTVTFGSSSFSGGLRYTVSDLHLSNQVAVLGISLYVLGFALGPLLFAPMSELFGRRIVFLVTLAIYAPLQLGGSLGHNLPTLLTCRLLTGIFGSAPSTNAGGVVADIWDVRERGTAAAIYSIIPFLGPIVGPIVGGFVAENPKLGWRFNFWLMCIFGCLSLFTNFLLCPETYSPVLLRRRATELTNATNGTITYVSKHDLNPARSSGRIIIQHLSRPFQFIITEPIVSLFAIYVAIVYGTLYALFSAYPIVFQNHRGWSSSESGLAFIGIGAGVALGLATSTIQNRIYWREMQDSPCGQTAPPEARLHMAMVGAVLCPVGLFWFAWTSSPSVHWIVPILAGVPFGTGTAQILQGASAYLMDTYGIFFASAISSTVVLRSICGAIFPLVSPAVFARLGDAWAMSVFGILSVVCMPIPFLFWKHGAWVRSRSKYAFQGHTNCVGSTRSFSITSLTGTHNVEKTRVVTLVQ